MGFPGGTVVKKPPANAGDASSIPGSGRSPGEGNGNPLRYSCLENSTDRGGWWATAHGVAKESDTTQQLISKKQPFTTGSLQATLQKGRTEEDPDAGKD